LYTLLRAHPCAHLYSVPANGFTKCTCNVSYIAIHLYFSVEINNSSDFVGGNIFCRLVLCDNKWANAKITSESEMSIVTDAIGYLAEVEILRSVRTMM